MQDGLHEVSPKRVSLPEPTRQGEDFQAEAVPKRTAPQFKVFWVTVWEETSPVQPRSVLPRPQQRPADPAPCRKRYQIPQLTELFPRNAGSGCSPGSRPSRAAPPAATTSPAWRSLRLHAGAELVFPAPNLASPSRQPHRSVPSRHAARPTHGSAGARRARLLKTFRGGTGSIFTDAELQLLPRGHALAPCPHNYRPCHQHVPKA